MAIRMGRRAPVRLSLLAGASAIAIALGAHLATAQSDKVVARVNGEAITARTVELAQDDVGQSLGSLPAPAKQEYIVSFLTDLQVLAQAAEKAGLPDNDAFKERLAYLRDKALMQEYLERETAKEVTPEKVRAFYDSEIGKAPKETEVKARHILLDNEDEAKALIAELKKGADFVALAREKTKDPAGKEDGGDLGFFTKDQMVPEFAEAAFAMQPGQLSEAPVKSQFGWHVIRLEERREKQAPAFEEIKERIEQYLARKAQSDLITKLRAEAKIEKTETPATPDPDKPAEPPKAQ